MKVFCMLILLPAFFFCFLTHAELSNGNIFEKISEIASLKMGIPVAELLSKHPECKSFDYNIEEIENRSDFTGILDSGNELLDGKVLSVVSYHFLNGKLNRIDAYWPCNRRIAQVLLKKQCSRDEVLFLRKSFISELVRVFGTSFDKALIVPPKNLSPSATPSQPVAVLRLKTDSGFVFASIAPPSISPESSAPEIIFALSIREELEDPLLAAKPAGDLKEAFKEIDADIAAVTSAAAPHPGPEAPTVSKGSAEPAESTRQ